MGLDPIEVHAQLPALPPDVEIAHETTLRPITDVAADAGILPGELEHFGRAKAKVHLSALARVASRTDGKLILVTAMNATPAGEGKTVTAIGLAEALGRVGIPHVLALRQPSLGPTFGIKGGAAGGGRAQVVPMEDINLHFTGDFHAVTAAHNLLAACVDNSVHWGNPLGIEMILWRRVMDLCDRQLREMEGGLGGKGNGWPHSTGFDITASSEIMAIIALAEGLDDLQTRLERIVVGLRADGSPVFAREIGCVGAMMALLRDALDPNLVQTLEGTPVLIHAGPFANIAHGCNSVIATKLALKLSPHVITEAGFGADLGAEKFFNIKCRLANLHPDVAVLVVSCRALRWHGVGAEDDFREPNVEALRRGLENVRVHLENIAKFGVPAVIAINHFPGDPLDEIDAIRQFAHEHEVPAAVSEVAAFGGEGGIALAREVLRVIEHRPSEFRPLYSVKWSVREKIETIAREIYRADGVDVDEAAAASIVRIRNAGLADLPVCIAKTQLSLSDKPKLRGAPTGWRLRVRDVRISNGAGFLVAIAGKMLLMPGMPQHGAFERIHLDDHGEIAGLS